MTLPELAPEIVDYYTAHTDEATRLTTSADGALELARTREILHRQLPPAPARVLDVGGGAGIHAQWLTDSGYDTQIIDPVPRHIHQARHTGLPAEIGDARALDTKDDSYDVVLLLGPLYHLLERHERDQALAEATRVTRPGGLIAAAAINRYASLFEHTATTLLSADRVRDAVTDILATGRHEPGRKGFTAAYFHTATSLQAELSDAGIHNVTVTGIEGPTWSALKAAETHAGNSLTDTEMFAAALTAARLAEPYPELLAASSHMLATGIAPHT